MEKVPLKVTLETLFPFSITKRKIAIEMLRRVRKGEYDVTWECAERLAKDCNCCGTRTVINIKTKLESFNLIQKTGNYHTGKMILGKNIFKTEWDEILTSGIS